MDLKIASDEDRKKWDSLIAASYGGTVFHTLKFLECMESYTTMSFLHREFRGSLYPLVAREGTAIVALFPLFVYSNHGIRIIGSGHGREDLQYLGPVFIGGDCLKPSKLQIRALRLQKALDLFFKRDLKAHAIYLRPSPFYPDARPYLWSGYDVQPLHTNFYYLDKGPDAIWTDLNKGVRKIITNAQKKNITVELGTPDDAGLIFELLSSRNRTSSPKSLVLDIVKTLFPDNCSIFTVRRDGNLLSGVIVLHYGRYAHLWVGFPGSDIEYLGANELLMWESIKWAHAKGFQILENTGGDDIDTFQFKRKFNPTLKQYLKADGSSFFFRSYKYIRQLIIPPRKDLERYCGEE